MRKDYNYLFTLNSLPKPSDTLFDKVMLRIKNEQKLRAVRLETAIFSLSTVFFGIAFVRVFQIIRVSFIESDFFRFFSLIFSDFEEVVAYGNSFILFLLESIPVIGLIALLILILALAYSIKRLTKDLKIIFNSLYIKHAL